MCSRLTYNTALIVYTRNHISTVYRYVHNIWFISSDTDAADVAAVIKFHFEIASNSPLMAKCQTMSIVVLFSFFWFSTNKHNYTNTCTDKYFIYAYVPMYFIAYKNNMDFLLRRQLPSSSLSFPIVERG